MSPPLPPMMFSTFDWTLSLSAPSPSLPALSRLTFTPAARPEYMIVSRWGPPW
jgi:hypothetical protein